MADHQVSALTTTNRQQRSTHTQTHTRPVTDGITDEAMLWAWSLYTLLLHFTLTLHSLTQHTQHMSLRMAPHMGCACTCVLLLVDEVAMWYVVVQANMKYVHAIMISAQAIVHHVPLHMGRRTVHTTRTCRTITCVTLVMMGAAFTKTCMLPRVCNCRSMDWVDKI
jgi:hypothetical protein